MEYNKIVAVTGLPGLFELINSKNDGAIVKSLEDQSTKFVSSRIHNFSHLESIEVYTSGDNVNLVEILNAMSSSDTALPNEKDADAVKKYFQKVYPEMDFERVYASDMKKMIKWYSVLKQNNVEVKLSEVPEEESSETETVTEEKAPAEKPKAPKKATAKKTAGKPAETEEKAAPAKKKKKAE
jgi:hypothetical protein